MGMWRFGDNQQKRQEGKWRKKGKRAEKMGEVSGPNKKIFVSLQRQCNGIAIKPWELADTKARIQSLYLYTLPTPTELDWRNFCGQTERFEEIKEQSTNTSTSLRMTHILLH